MLYLRMNGANGATVFYDDSPSHKAVTTVGGAAISTTESRFKGSSGYFDGAGDYLTLADSEDWNFGTGNLTVDFWMWCDTTSGIQMLIGQSPSSGSRWVIYTATGTPSLYDTGTTLAIDAGGAFTASAWNHIALVRNGTSFVVYLNGVGGTPGASSSAMADVAGVLSIGRQEYDSQYFTGYLAEVRVSKGIARWTANFTPPTRQLI
jgi:hypothetical protein